jgi:hypothetical protein
MTTAPLCPRCKLTISVLVSRTESLVVNPEGSEAELQETLHYLCPCGMRFILTQRSEPIERAGC